MIGAIVAYLNSLGTLPPVGEEFIPEKPDAYAGLFMWDCPAASDGTCARFVQVRVRDTTYEAAMQKCAAIVAILDSGQDETPLAVKWQGAPIIGIVRRRPIIYSRDASAVTVYAEIALWGQN